MSSSSAPTDSETISPTDGARGSPVFTPFPDDPYMLVRHAYSPTTPDTEFEPLEAPLETRKPHLLFPHISTAISPKTTTYLDITYPYTSMSILLPQYCMDGRAYTAHPTPSSSSSPASSPTLPSQKRYWGTSKLIVDTEIELSQLCVTDEDEPSGFGYWAARRHGIERDRDTFAIIGFYYMVARYLSRGGQSSRSAPDSADSREDTLQNHAWRLPPPTWDDPGGRYRFT
ncbi:hypothetical protein Tco_0780151 [Tanacetum coccineum]